MDKRFSNFPDDEEGRSLLELLKQSVLQQLISMKTLRVLNDKPEDTGRTKRI